MLRVPFYTVLGHFAAQRIPVDSQLVGRLGKVAVGTGHDARNEPALEFARCLRKADAPLNHFFYQSIELFVHCSSRPLSRRNACTYFSRVFSITSSGRLGTGGCLFQRIDSR